MRVLFNQWSTIGKKTGVGHCAQQLLSQLRQCPELSVQGMPSDRWIAMERRIRTLLSGLRSLKPRGKLSRWLHPFAAFGLFGGVYGQMRYLRDRWLERTQQAMLFGDEFDLYHEPNFIPLPSSHKTVTTLHDLSVLLHPEWHPKARVEWYERSFSQTLRQSDHLIAVSEFTRRQVQRHLYVPANRVTRVYNAARPEFQPLARKTVAEMLQKRGLPARYLLYVGTIEPRKNILRLMQAYCALPEPIRLSCPLLLVGQWGWNVASEQKYYEDEAGHRGVCQIGYLADDLMPAIYNGARALVYPSLYEGFGLPPLEMLACGGAVLGSTAEAIAEVVGKQGELIAPENVDGWRTSMMRVIIDDDWHQQLRHGAQETARDFSWQRCAEETVAVYRRVLAHEQPNLLQFRRAA
jgi:alpha-1,3-rhamnosyl/mannosyltransferase